MPARRNDKNFPTALRYRPYLLAECGAGWNSLLRNGFGNLIVKPVYCIDVLLQRAQVGVFSGTALQLVL
jgi:hypothetical protein